MKFLIICVAAGLISSCAQTEYTGVQGNEIKHSSPRAKPLYVKENAELRRIEGSGSDGPGGFLNWFLDGFVGSDPDDDYYYSRDEHQESSSRSSKRKKQFISKNGETLRDKLESKKQ